MQMIVWTSLWRPPSFFLTMHRSSPASSAKGSSGGQKPGEGRESQTREEEPKGQTSKQSESTTTCLLLQN